MTRPAPLLFAFLLSGASGLAYEVVWARQLAVMVGGTAHATQAVLAMFFVGVAAGAFLLGRRAAAAVDGRRFYARLELAIAGSGVLSGVGLHLLRGPVAAATDGRDGPATAAIALGVTLVTCAPATLLMGATLAAVTRAVQQHGERSDGTALLGRAYAMNTAGAVLGSVGGAFIALPLLGVRGTLALAVLGNLLAAALSLPRRNHAGPDTHAPAAQAPAAPRRLPTAFALALTLSGFAAISLEIVALRVLAVTLLDTVYTFAIAIAAYIGGAAATAAIVSRRPRTSALPPALLLALATLAAAAWLPTLRVGASLHQLVSGEHPGFWARVGSEALVAVLLAAPAAVPTTWVFLALAGHPSVGGAAVGAGKATAWNGIGCAAAPLVSALVLLPLGGTFALACAAIAALGIATLAMAIEMMQRDPRRADARGPTAGVVALLALAALPVLAVREGLHTWVVTPGWRLLWAREGASASVSVEESPDGLRRLRTNNNFTEGGDAAGVSQIRQGMLPTLFHPDARRVLVLGVGSGITLAGVVAGAPQATFDAVELLPEIGRAVGHFSRTHGGVERHPGVTLHVADARTFAAHAARGGTHYDLVVGELFHAAQAGTGALYAREHFETVRRLIGGTPRGIYCQWLPLHETPPREVRTIVRTFFRVFPHGAAFLGGWNLRTAILGLVGSDVPLALDWDATLARLNTPGELARRAVQSELARLAETLATFVAPAEEMLRWAGDGPENTDDRPELELGAPRSAAGDLAPENLVHLLDVRQPPHSLVRWGDPARRERVIAIQDASSAFIRGTHAWLHLDLARAETELRRAVERSPDFPHAERALRDLAATLREAGAAEQAASILGWLETRR